MSNRTTDRQIQELSLSELALVAGAAEYKLRRDGKVTATVSYLSKDGEEVRETDQQRNDLPIL